MQAQASQKKKAGKCSLSITFHTYSSCARKYIFSGPASLNYKLKECCLPLLMWQNRELHILDLIYLLNWLSCSIYIWLSHWPKFESRIVSCNINIFWAIFLKKKLVLYETFLFYIKFMSLHNNLMIYRSFFFIFK